MSPSCLFLLPSIYLLWLEQSQFWAITCFLIRLSDASSSLPIYIMFCSFSFISLLDDSELPIEISLYPSFVHPNPLTFGAKLPFPTVSPIASLYEPSIELNILPLNTWTLHICFCLFCSLDLEGQLNSIFKDADPIFVHPKFSWLEVFYIPRTLRALSVYFPS